MISRAVFIEAVKDALRLQTSKYCSSPPPDAAWLIMAMCWFGRSVDGTTDFLRLNIYLSKDGDFVTIWFGLIDPIVAQTKLQEVEKPDDFNLNVHYNEDLFRGYIETEETARCILNALRFDISGRYTPQRLSGSDENKLQCHPY